MIEDTAMVFVRCSFPCFCIKHVMLHFLFCGIWWAQNRFTNIKLIERKEYEQKI